MRKICLAVLIAVSLAPSGNLAPFAYSQTQITNILKIDTPQTDKPLIRQDRGDEIKMIKSEELYTYFTIKVTTTNQRRFDGNRDGYLNGKELQMYLREYYK